MNNDHTTANISIDGTRITIQDVTIESPEAAQYVSRFPQDEWGLAFSRIVDVGVAALSRASGTLDMEFMRHKADAIIRQIEEATGKMPAEIGESLRNQIGVEEGQALEPVKELIDGLQAVVDEKLNDVKNMLRDEIDPSRESSTMGKSFRKMGDLLDPKRTDSIPGTIDAKLKEVTARDGDLGKLVKDIVDDSLHGVRRQITDLSNELRAQEAVEQALANTTAKGYTYEDEVVLRLAAWGNPMGISVEHVGSDNKPGDVVVTFPGLRSDDTAFVVVVEARDRTSPKGRAAISKDLDQSRDFRSADAAVYVSRTVAGLAKEIGDFAEGDGTWVACSDEHLITAMRLLQAQYLIKQTSAEHPSVDTEAIRRQIERIRTTLNRVRNINTKASSVRAGADAIQSEAGTLRDDIREALAELEEVLRSKPDPRDDSS